ncbi:hypothetical protein A1OQ_20430 [Enterovibrio norvegicus FF-162]|uniref:hypothetical protein n=1 Tax=Enterovibrio norvegicus TaxID=188144 RepID=UPI0003191DD0|nr:hypothetical protein [Enterovibrio norvegicus]OEE81966.1 hypothetical protein A1OQ_20430 [Enterovibrio norvegicus FF-162]
MNYRHLFPFFISISVLSACAVPQPAIQANGVIVWSNGVEEKVRVSPSNDHFVFVSNGFSGSQVVVYSRINGASTPECEYYVNEPKPAVRLTVCGEGEVELLNNGVVQNVGQLSVFTS